MSSSSTRDDKYGHYARVVPSFVFYGSYHAHPMNQLVHVIFVPAILLTSFVFANYADLTHLLPSSLAGFVTPYVGTLSLDLIAALYYMGTYVYLCPNAVGIGAAILVLLGLVSAQAFVAEYGAGAWLPALVLHVISWILQVHVGHNIYEKRAPALLDNLYQVRVGLTVLTSAPLCQRNATYAGSRHGPVFRVLRMPDVRRTCASTEEHYHPSDCQGNQQVSAQS
jgi:2-hydroxy fatty acid dioxygenase